jgi:hypothetical protein
MRGEAKEDARDDLETAPVHMDCVAGLLMAIEKKRNELPRRDASLALPRGHGRVRSDLRSQDAEHDKA